jgi:hypothetical protein
MEVQVPQLGSAENLQVDGITMEYYMEEKNMW